MASYDAKADVLYVSFKKPSRATDSELTDDDVIICYEGEEIVGLTVLHARIMQPLFCKSRGFPFGYLLVVVVSDQR